MLGCKIVKQTSWTVLLWRDLFHNKPPLWCWFLPACHLSSANQIKGDRKSQLLFSEQKSVTSEDCVLSEEARSWTKVVLEKPTAGTCRPQKQTYPSNRGVLCALWQTSPAKFSMLSQWHEGLLQTQQVFLQVKRYIKYGLSVKSNKVQQYCRRANMKADSPNLSKALCWITDWDFRLKAGFYT